MRIPKDHPIRDLFMTTRIVETVVNRRFRSEGLSWTTYTILLELDDHPEGLTCTQIANELTSPVPDMTRLLDRMERLGYVTRARGTDDRRSVRVKISPQGRAAIEARWRAAERVIQDVFGILSAHQGIDFRTSLQMIRAKAEAIA